MRKATDENPESQTFYLYSPPVQALDRQPLSGVTAIGRTWPGLQLKDNEYIQSIVSSIGVSFREWKGSPAVRRSGWGGRGALCGGQQRRSKKLRAGDWYMLLLDSGSMGSAFLAEVCVMSTIRRAKSALCAKVRLAHHLADIPWRKRYAKREAQLNSPLDDRARQCSIQRNGR